MSNYHEQMKQHDIEMTRQIMSNLPPFVSDYVRSIQFHTTPKTRLEYIKDIRNFFEYLIDADATIKDLKSITTTMLEAIPKVFFEEYLDYLQHYEKNGKIYKNGEISIKRKLSALRNFYSYLFKNDLISTNIISRVEIPKLRHKEIIRLDYDEMQDFLDAVEYGNNKSKKQTEYHMKQKTRDLAIVTLLLSTGIRVSECVGLNLDDVNMKNSSLKITRKGDKESIVYFSDEASGYLQEYIEERKWIDTDEKNALFLSSRKKRMSVRTLETLIKKYAASSVPLKKITPHKLRSTYGTNLYEETSDIYLVAETLGHADVSTTKKHYADLSNERKEQNRNKVSLRKN